MVATAQASGGQGEAGAAARLGFSAGQVIQELGYADDVDQGLRQAVEEIVGGELVDEEYDDIVDGVILWWRDDDGDLTDALVDAPAALDESGGTIWLLTPKPGRPGHVAYGEIEEAAATAGLHTTSTLPVAADWSGTRLGTRNRR